MSEGVNLSLLERLGLLADQLVAELEADACAVSRVIGDVLILVAERVTEGHMLLQGQGYLVPDYPQTAEVLATGIPCTLTLADSDVDDAEAQVLRDQGYTSLMMLPLEVGGDAWGLVEVYRVRPVPFSDDDVRRAVELSRVG
jgi:transcriptional regulator with GAF, ATPase, and Fis domain